MYILRHDYFKTAVVCIVVFDMQIFGYFNAFKGASVCNAVCIDKGNDEFIGITGVKRTLCIVHFIVEIAHFNGIAAGIAYSACISEDPIAFEKRYDKNVDIIFSEKGVDIIAGKKKI